MKQVTILFLRQDNQLLLAMKKRGFGADKWNGVGGKVDPGETVEQAAIRECQEEIGVLPRNIRQVGRLQFFDPTDASFHHDCFIFDATEWEGEPVETEEMRPQWFTIETIPYDKMWADDELWLPLLIEGTRFEGTIHVDDQAVTSHEITILDNDHATKMGS
jgi:mutator protein MutT